MSIFSLTCQVGGVEHSVRAERRGGGIAILSDAGVQYARGLDRATRFAGEILGPHLERARRGGLPWGLLVEVGGNQAVYGDWPLLPGPSEPVRKRRPSTLSRLRALWRDEDGALSALNNALRIVEELGEQLHRAAA
jgi:hypothetical protein